MRLVGEWFTLIALSVVGTTTGWAQSGAPTRNLFRAGQCFSLRSDGWSGTGAFSFPSHVVLDSGVAPAPWLNGLQTMRSDSTPFLRIGGWRPVADSGLSLRWGDGLFRLTIDLVGLTDTLVGHARLSAELVPWHHDLPNAVVRAWRTACL